MKLASAIMPLQGDGAIALAACGHAHQKLVRLAARACTLLA